MERRPKQTFLQRHAYAQQAHEKMCVCYIPNHQGNPNQNQNEVSPHTHQNCYHQIELK